MTEKKRGLIVCAFFSALLTIGLAVLSDYGVSWDEPHSRENGVMTLRYILSGDSAELGQGEKYHGAAFELLLAVLEKTLALRDLRNVYLFRHLANFLFFYFGIVVFYRLACASFQSWRLGLLGSACLALSPRIFADAFYNPKDIPCLVMFIVSISTLIGYLDHKTPGRALAHAAACAVLIDIRIMGVLVPLLTAVFLALDEAAARTSAGAKACAKTAAVFALALAAFTVLLWPILWRDPLHHFIEAFKQETHARWPSSVLYLGRYIKGSSLPWHYIPVWVLISTPPVYSALFGVGTFSVLVRLKERPRKFYRENRDDLIFASWFFLPLAGVFVFRPTLYDAWRHFFFIYPAFLLIALRGYLALRRFIEASAVARRRAAVGRLLTLALGCSLIHVAWTMARLHPYQHLYFNRLAGRTMGEIKNSFELDYWGLCYRRALEHILHNDKRPKIKAALAAYPSGLASVNMLAPEDRKRLSFPLTPGEEVDYFLSNYRWHKEEYPEPNPYYSIEIDGAKVLVVYKRPEAS